MVIKSLAITREIKDNISKDVSWASLELAKAKDLGFGKVTFSIENHRITTLKTESTKKCPSK